MNTYNPLIELLLTYKPNNYTRLSWDDYFISQAILTSFRSPSQKLQVGAVITLNNRIVSTGYNGYFSGAPHQSIHVDGHEINTVHAEQNAIADAAKRGVSINGATMYITHYPCLNCAKLIIASGIQHIKYLNDYHNDPVVQSLLDQLSIPIIRLSHCLQLIPTSPVNYLCSIPIINLTGCGPNLFLILNQKQFELLKSDHLINPTYYEKQAGCCEYDSGQCYACSSGGFKYQVDQMRKISEITIENICLNEEIIHNQPFGTQLLDRLAILEEPQSPLN